jgi:hypothetical protein
MGNLVTNISVLGIWKDKGKVMATSRNYSTPIFQYKANRPIEWLTMINTMATPIKAAR